MLLSRALTPLFVDHSRHSYGPERLITTGIRLAVHSKVQNKEEYMSDRSDEELLQKVNILIRLVAYQLVAEKTASVGAPILRRLGLTPVEIAAVFGTSREAINVRLAEAKRPASGNRKASTRPGRAGK
jgi:hypothetical protein